MHSAALGVYISAKFGVVTHPFSERPILIGSWFFGRCRVVVECDPPAIISSLTERTYPHLIFGAGCLSYGRYIFFPIIYSNPLKEVSLVNGTKCWQLVRLAILGLSGLGMGSCSSLQPAEFSSNAAAQVPLEPQAAIIQSAPAQDTPHDVTYTVCSELPTWERPALEVHLAELNSNPRYSGSLGEEPLKSLSDKFWNQSIITFTTYGLSARVEPVYLSGLWTAIADAEACYTPPLTEAINQGQLAEMWLMGFRVTAFEWTGEHYRVVVEPAAQGVQFVQFERLEANAALPIVVVATNGSEMTFASGDW